MAERDNKIKIRAKTNLLTRKKALQENGWTVLRFWESEINKNIDKVVNIVVRTLYCKKRSEFGQNHSARKDNSSVRFQME